MLRGRESSNRHTVYFNKPSSINNLWLSHQIHRTIIVILVTGGSSVPRQGGEAVAEGRTLADAEGEACWADDVAGRLAAEEQPSPTADAGALAASALLSAQVERPHNSCSQASTVKLRVDSHIPFCLLRYTKFKLRKCYINNNCQPFLKLSFILPIKWNLLNTVKRVLLLFQQEEKESFSPISE